MTTAILKTSTSATSPRGRLAVSLSIAGHALILGLAVGWHAAPPPPPPLPPPPLVTLEVPPPPPIPAAPSPPEKAPPKQTPPQHPAPVHHEKPVPAPPVAAPSATTGDTHLDPPISPRDEPSAPTSAPIATGPTMGVRELDHPPPSYPASARRLRQQGEVIVELEVATDGYPVSASVRASSGYPALDDAALTAVKTWRFAPALLNGKPIAARVEIPVVFRLQG